MKTGNWLQLIPQYAWHGDALIEGNRDGLKSLAAALLVAADSDGTQTETMFASDGEGYKINIRRHELPADFSSPYYSFETEHCRARKA